MVYPGEFLAVTGIRENGIESFEALLMGIVRGTSGVVRLFGREYDRLGPRILRKEGIAYVPTDRLGSGASVLSTVAENLMIRERRRFHRFGVLRKRSIETLAESAADRFGIEGDPNDQLNRLSGGNIQKVILSREMRGTPPLLFVAEPSWGLDLRSRHLLYRQLLELRQKGSAVVLITTDLDEVQALADRVVVLYRGRNVAEYTHDEMDREKLGQAMIGQAGHGFQGGEPGSADGAAGDGEPGVTGNTPGAGSPGARSKVPGAPTEGDWGNNHGPERTDS